MFIANIFSFSKTISETFTVDKSLRYSVGTWRAKLVYEDFKLESILVAYFDWDSFIN